MFIPNLQYLLCPSLVVLLVVSSIGHCNGQVLKAEYVDAKLLSPNGCPRPFYDGNDKIYLLGGRGMGVLDQISVYSLSSDTIERVGNLPGPALWGTIQSDNLGNIFYLGGGVDYRDVYKFNPLTNMTTVVAQLPYLVSDSISFKFSDNIVYILGGWEQSNEVLAFHLQLYNYSIVTSVDYYVHGGASVRLGDTAYIFAEAGLRRALELNLNTLEMNRVGHMLLPEFQYLPSSVIGDGNFAFVMGGYNSNNGPTDGIIQFNTNTFDNTFLPVRNFPVEGEGFFFVAPASVFVPGSNRIYFFGGESYSPLNGFVIHDEIFYIELAPPVSTTTTENPQTTSTENPPTTTEPSISTTTLNPDFFTCTNRTTGLYPHPTDCSMYIGCQDEEMIFFTCPPPLLYDPELTTCNYPDQVECGISCVDKPDGNYPHPHDCSLYIICRSGVPNVFKCQSPLFFDPAQRICYFVPCSTSWTDGIL